MKQILAALQQIQAYRIARAEKRAAYSRTAEQRLNALRISAVVPSAECVQLVIDAMTIKDEARRDRALKAIYAAVENADDTTVIDGYRAKDFLEANGRGMTAAEYWAEMFNSTMTCVLCESDYIHTPGKDGKVLRFETKPDARLVKFFAVRGFTG
jgi:hypothetical protein